MTVEEAFEIFCQEANITDPITRELRIKPIYMAAWKTAEINQKYKDTYKACEWLSNHTMVDTDLFRKAMESKL